MKNRNEIEAVIRTHPQAYIAEYDANGNVEYEAWAYPGAATTDSVWIACKNTYNADNQLTRTKWAQGTRTNINGDTVTETGTYIHRADSLSTLTYV